MKIKDQSSSELLIMKNLYGNTSKLSQEIKQSNQKFCEEIIQDLCQFNQRIDYTNQKLEQKPRCKRFVKHF